jgi:hypothetical protein
MTTSDKPLNKVEIWVAERAAPIFGLLVVLILLGAIAVFVTYQRSGNAEDQISVLKPQVTKVAGAICDRQSLRSQHPERAARCAERIRIGLINCRQVPECRAALLAAITYPPPARNVKPSSSKTTSPGTTPGDTGGGDAFQPSNHGHQHAGPGSQPGPSPSPTPAPAEPVAPGNSGGHSQGNGPPITPPGQSSGASVEVCALERTCVGVEVGAPDPKGLLP